MIHIYKIDPLTYTPFDKNFSKEDFSYLEQKDLKITTNKKKADIFLAGNHKSLKRFILKNPFLRNYLVWSQEPRFSKIKSTPYYPFSIFPEVHLMNIYTEDVFLNNVTNQDKKFITNQKLNIIDSSYKLSNRKVAALMSFYHGGKYSKLTIDGLNIDLIKKRSEIALFLFKNNMIDIYGQGWPTGISMEDSRFNERHKRKKDILKKYHFNLCFENTVYPKYITEKIWESIENKCLPIYFGGTGSSIYELFPTKSFIDYSELEDPEKLKDLINNMPDVEFICRLNKCIEVYNSFIEKPDHFWRNSRKQMLDKIVEKCNYIVK
ncbi:glycosyltransferase family 10 domain-containing protein [Christiangramia echinicola]|uniref:glycosyltransferase family 10 domain-containing protein n=1 Tax=Christiangramia echinicola TaxID=279359 RepID=UPI0004089726|nr:glycosyltransferase family 10 [Christiangramia echinicola]